MDPRLRTALAVVIAVVVAVFCSMQLAEGAYFWPGFIGSLVVASVLIWQTGLAADTILFGLVAIGYIVGNRGFAQLTPAPGVPLLPAEAALLVGFSWRLIQGAFKREVPFKRDSLNWAVLVWLVAGTVRVGFDVRQNGFNALRDYAMVYYAVFFFLAQDMAAKPRARRYLIGCLLVGVTTLVPVYALYQIFEHFFITKLVLAGAPLIYYKGDIAVIHLAVGSVLLFHWATGRHRQWAWPLATGMILFLLAHDSRSALVGVLVAGGLLLVARRWRYPVIQGSIAGIAFLAVLTVSVLFDNTWANRKVEGLMDRAASLVDFGGLRHYQSEESFDKGANNRFRLVWWKNVILETSTANPVFGLGFGTDLAAGFLQEYYPEGGEDFSARSPHNIFLTVYARMGGVGLAVWLVFCALLLRTTWRSLRHEEDPVAWGLWTGAWVILVGGTFGVVLEGPMGAVIFWIMLGLANTRTVTPAAPAQTDPVRIPIPPESAQP